MTYDSILNRNDYFSAHYLADVLPRELKAKDGLLARWAAIEDEARREYEAAKAEAERSGADLATLPARRRTPRQGLRALHGTYFDSRAYFADTVRRIEESGGLATPGDWTKRLIELQLATLRALGYTDAHEQTLSLERAGREQEIQVLHAEPGVVAVSCGWTAEPDAALDPEGAGALTNPARLDAGEELLDGKAMVRFLFETQEPPRFVLLVAGGVLVLADRTAWADGRYLAVSLDTALDRKDDRHGGELDTIAALFGAAAVRVPEDGGEAPLATLVANSGKHAVGVSTELREGLRVSVELIANEVLARLDEAHVSPADFGDPALAKRLSREALRYLYRILFLLYAESRPELGILPVDYPEYGAGYGLQRLGDLVVRDLVGEQSRTTFHFYESLAVLFDKVDTGYRPYGTEPEDVAADAADREASRAETEAARLFTAGEIDAAEHTTRMREADRLRRSARSADVGLRFEALKAALFKPEAIGLIGRKLPNPLFDEEDPDSEHEPFIDTRLRNETLHKVLRRLMLTKGSGRERGGFISYAKLGINQLGAVYEGLMSYTGFIATENLYEVAKGGDPSGGSWMIPESKAAEYAEDVRVMRANEETGVPEWVVHPKGTFVYRLSGRDRQTSASYYTPESLTKVTVELALKYRLDQDGTTTPARELLDWKICEPALGSGAFLNEAINQVAEEYLRRRERELGVLIDPEQRPVEVQKAKAHIALHNAYGVDLNATAVELAEVSLWLNTMHPGMRAPWFGLHLRRGNSLIGASRKVYAAEDLPKGLWASKKDTQAPKELPFRDGPLPDGAVHQFLLPALGWGAVADETEAKKLAPEQQKAMAAWRKALHRKPAAKGKNNQVARLQGLARRTEYLWNLVVERLRISEQDISRHIDVWGADWLTPHEEAVDKEKIREDLTYPGTPYWRLKLVMDTWCALWFWPLDRIGELDGSELAAGGAVPTPDPNPTTERQSPPEPTSGPMPGDLDWTSEGLFDNPNGEQTAFDSSLGKQPKAAAKRATGTRHTQIVDARREQIALKDWDDWLDFLEAALGTTDMEGLFPHFESLEVMSDFERTLAGLMGMDEPVKLATRFPWVSTVEDIAGSTERDIQAEDGQGFFHWELQFAHVFAGEGGGFDLQVGNPPWVRPRWEEDLVLAESDPWFALAQKPTVEQKSERKCSVLASLGQAAYFFSQLEVSAGLNTMLGSIVVYPVLVGTQPDLYRAFMCRAWANFGRHGLAGLIHPDTHFGGIKEGRLRAAAYRRLRIHAHFSNRENLFEEVEGTRQFGVHIYGPARRIDFMSLNWLFHPMTLSASLEHDGSGEPPGIKHQGAWDLRPHRARLVQVDEARLETWRRLSGGDDMDASQNPLVYPVTNQEQGAISALTAFGARVADLEPRISSGYHESNGKRDGLIVWSEGDPDHLSDVILQGPHLGVATPFGKQPNIPCRTNRDWSGWNLSTLSVDAVPRANYVRSSSCSVERFTQAQDRWLDRDGRKLPYTEFFRLAWRVMIPFDTERSLFAAVVPPGPAHVNTIQSMALAGNRETVLAAGFWGALPLDYLLRISGRSHLQMAEARQMPAADPEHPLAAALLLRALRLNCLTGAYEPLWEELFDATWLGGEHWVLDWPRLAPLTACLKPTWHYATPLRGEMERRAALVELDALVAVWLGMTADQLVAIYKSRYPVLSDYESRMWFDANGRKIAGNHNTYGFGQTKEDFEAFLAFECGERATPPDGYEAPFYKADREGEMREAHAHFSARLQAAIDRGEWEPSARRD
ncbi:hypothetical protein GCM10023205_19720 [Yinghuangia aomiensis]|uniref:site-specific DNA-methyltransferase (adenine-specific) n=1 Tax=Yinghuangia aomiensis TaxID=676205 RepID=A0ABP9GYU9_9ACTN